jgi:hypothetical protein
MVKQVVEMGALGVVCCFFLLMLQDAGVGAQLPSPSQSTGFCESFVSSTTFKCTEELVSMNLLELCGLIMHSKLLVSSLPQAFSHVAYSKDFIVGSNFQVQTQDGFLLAVQRISTKNPLTVAKGPAFLYHGIMQVLKRKTFKLDACLFVNMNRIITVCIYTKDHIY